MNDLTPITNLLANINDTCTCQPPYDTMLDRTDPDCEYHNIGAEEIEAARAWGVEHAPHWKIFETMGHAQKAVDGVLFDAQTAERQCKMLNRDNAPLKYHAQAFAPTSATDEQITAEGLLAMGFEKEPAHDKDAGLSTYRLKNVNVLINIADGEFLFAYYKEFMTSVDTMQDLCDLCRLMGVSS